MRSALQILANLSYLSDNFRRGLNSLILPYISNMRIQKISAFALTLGLVLTGFPQISLATALKCSEVFDSDFLTNDKLHRVPITDRSKSQTHRGFWDYLGTFGNSEVRAVRATLNTQGKLQIENVTNLESPLLERSLFSLNSKSHVLDAGSGQMLFINDLIFNLNEMKNQKNGSSEGLRWINSIGEKFLNEGSPNFTGITMVPVDESGFFSNRFQATTDKVSYANLVASGKVNPLTGRYMEAISNSELTQEFGMFDLVFDLYGVLSYSHHSDVIGKKLAATMKPGAELWMANTGLGNGHMAYFVNGESKGIDSLWQNLIQSGAFELIGASDANVMVFRRTNNPWSLH